MTEHTSLAIGFIGLGDQGLPMAIAIAEAGLDLHVWARRAASLDPLGDSPHVAHESVADLAAASDVVAICVGTDDDVLSLVRTGLVASMRPGSIIVNHGTGTPKNAQLIASIAAENGILVLDAPVSGGRQGAEARTLTALVGGPGEAFKRALPVFRSFSEHVIHLGEHGAGQLAKLFNNTLLMLNQANLADVLALGEASDLDPIRLAEVLRLGSGSSTALELLPLRSPTSLNEMAAHLSGVELLDMDIFADAMTDLGVDASETTERAKAGANSLPAVVHTLNP